MNGCSRNLNKKIEEKGKVTEEEKQEFVKELGDILSEESIFDAGL